MKLLDKDILLEDNHLLVVNKPSGLLTLSTKEVNDSVVERGREYLVEKYNKKGNAFLHQAHRLDRAASGIVVLAKTSKALSRLNEQIREGKWEKEYILRADKLPKNKEGELIHFIVKESFRGVVADEKTPLAKRAHLSYKVEDDGLIRVKLYTGRYHQIRIQFSEIGCPICGDKKYGSRVKGIREGIDLHHTKLTFIHPVSKESITINAGTGGL